MAILLVIGTTVAHFALSGLGGCLGNGYFGNGYFGACGTLPLLQTEGSTMAVGEPGTIWGRSLVFNQLAGALRA
jgi:hypothetical protein